MCDGAKELVKAEVADTEDFISELPDEILTSVLSYLPTKEVIRTSVLSKRLNRLWVTVPTLKLSVLDFLPRGNGLQNLKRAKANFLAFVERFLRRNQPCKINVLELTSFSVMAMEILSIKFRWSSVGRQDYENDPLYPGEIVPLSHSNLESWLLLARRFEVHCLHIFCKNNGIADLQLRPNFSMFEKLERLKISRAMVLNFPVGSIFPNLKVLKLDITFRDEYLIILNLINSSCPVLEDLTVSSRGDENDLDGLVINVKTLKRLTLGHWQFGGSSKISRKRINVPSLKYLSLDNVLITDNDSVGVWGTLNEADLNVSTEDFNSLFWLLLRNHEVNKLTLLENTLKSLKFCMVPMFHNLTCLEIQVVEDSAGWESLVKVLKMSPILEYLRLEGIYFNLEGVFDWNAEHDIPRCLTTSLKTIEINPINGFENELQIMGYFLKQSKVLEKITIHISSIGDQEIIKENILAFPKGSPECVIVFRQSH